MSTTQTALDTQELEQRVKEMYREVAEEPDKEFHFETGRPLAVRLGYPPADLDAIPAPSIDSFAGVGYYFDLAAISPARRSSTSAAAPAWTASSPPARPARPGASIGIDMTDAQLDKATRLADEPQLANVEFGKAYIEQSAAREPTRSTSSSPTASSTSRPTSRRSSPKQRASCARAAGSRSPTSSPPHSSPKASPATPRSGRPASAAPCSATTTARRSKPPASSSTT